MRKKLIQKRKELELTQQEISEKIGIARSTYNSYELGTTTPKFNCMIKIKELFNYYNDDLFFLETFVGSTDKNENNDGQHIKKE